MISAAAPVGNLISAPRLRLRNTAKHQNKQDANTYRKGKEKRVSGLTVSQEGWKEEAGWLPLPLCMWTPPSGSLSTVSGLSSSSSWAKASSSHAFWRNLTVSQRKVNRMWQTRKKSASVFIKTPRQKQRGGRIEGNGDSYKFCTGDKLKEEMEGGKRDETFFSAL